MVWKPFSKVRLYLEWLPLVQLVQLHWLAPVAIFARVVIACCVCALSVGVASAAGLGELRLHSSLGQHLNAEIDITAVKDTDLETLSAYMASAEVLAQMDIIYASVLQDIRFAVELDPAKGPVLKLSSVKPIREPFISLVVELSWAQGTYLREYTFLLDPVFAQSPDAVNSEASAAVSAAPPEPLSELIIVVQRGDNLLDIARSVQPEGVSIEQVALSIYDRNPRAFYGSVNKLKQGAELVIPVVTDIAMQSVSAARKVFNRQTLSEPPLRHSLAMQSTQSGLQSASDLPIDVALAEVDAPSQLAIAVASKQMGGVRRDIPDTSVSALRELILELRGAMLGLGKELNVKTTQLDEISIRVERLQAQQAKTIVPSNEQTTSLAAPVAALKKATAESLDDSPTTVSRIAKSSTKNLSIAIANNFSEANSDTAATADLGTSSAATSAMTTVANGASQADNLESTSTDVVSAVVGTINRLNQSETTSSTDENMSVTDADRRTDEQSLSTSAALVAASKAQALNPNEQDDDSLFSWFLDTKRNQLMSNRLRDAGLLALALILGYQLMRRLFGDLKSVQLDMGESVENADAIGYEPITTRTESNNADVVNPLSAIEFFRAQLTGEQQRERALIDELRDNPTRQEIRLDLLRVYHGRGAVDMFAQTAREMYAMTQGKNIEWHTVIQMGLKLDLNLDFYNEPQEHEFKLNDEFSVSGTKITSVPAGKSVASAPSSEQNSVGIHLDYNHQDHIDLDGQSESSDTDDDSITDYSITDDGITYDDKALDDVKWKSADDQALSDTDLNITGQPEPLNQADLSQDAASDQQATLNSEELQISAWKDSEVRLDLASVYIELGNLKGAKDLLNEVIANGDATQVNLAQALLDKL